MKNNIFFARLRVGVPHLRAADGRPIRRRPPLLPRHRVRLRLLVHHHGLHLPGLRHQLHLLHQHLLTDQDREGAAAVALFPLPLKFPFLTQIKAPSNQGLLFRVVISILFMFNRHFIHKYTYSVQKIWSSICLKI